MSITDRIARMRADYERLLPEARADLEAAVKAVEEKRAALVELEVAFGDLAGQAARARRPRHLMPALTLTDLQRESLDLGDTKLPSLDEIR